MWPFGNGSRPLPVKTVLISGVQDGQQRNFEKEVIPSQVGFGAVEFSNAIAVLRAKGKYDAPGMKDKGGDWQPLSGWSPAELVAAGFPPPQEPDRPVVEQLAIAVLRGDKTAWRPLIDAALEELGES